MSPNFNEADVSDKPAGVRKLPQLSAGHSADIRRKYRCELESLLSVDEGVRRVTDALAARGELGNTLLIYTSDNGYFHGEHRIPIDKERVYEESIRVPLQMRGPGIPQGVTISDLAINADLAPTIVDAANATPGLVMDGRSLIPVAQNPGIEQGRELLVEQPSFSAIRTGRYLYAEYNSGEKELYDLSNDPSSSEAAMPLRATHPRGRSLLPGCTSWSSVPGELPAVNRRSVSDLRRYRPGTPIRAPGP